MLPWAPLQWGYVLHEGSQGHLSIHIGACAHTCAAAGRSPTSLAGSEGPWEPEESCLAPVDSFPFDNIHPQGKERETEALRRPGKRVEKRMEGMLQERKGRHHALVISMCQVYFWGAYLT